MNHGLDGAIPTHATVPDRHHDETRPWWRVSPVTRRDVGYLALVWIGLTAIYSLVGLAITRWWEGSALGDADADLNRWFEDGRTETLTDLAHIGSAFSNTETKIVLAVVLAPVMLWLYREWRDWAWLTLTLILEVAVFGTASEIVRRDRPPVAQLDGAPTNSWPSGHIAAATVFYVGLAFVIWRNGRTRPSRSIAVLIGIVVPVCVILSRLYLGMHYVTDAIGGVVLGAVTLWVVDRTLTRRAARRSRLDGGVRATDDPSDAQLERTD